MFVQHTEAMLEEIDRMVWDISLYCKLINQSDASVRNNSDVSSPLQEEVEMKDVDEEPFVDIDNCDKKNPLAVVEYIDDIYKFYRKAEVLRSLFSFFQFLIDFHAQLQTFFL